jgi:hypothetical protein
MTPAQVYFLVAPIVLLIVVGGGVGIWLYVTRDEARRHSR